MNEFEKWLSEQDKFTVSNVDRFVGKKFLELCFLAGKKSALENQWQPIDEFQKLANEGWCWIVYKGRVTDAYHNHNQIFKYSKFSEHCYLKECITHVMPWDIPKKPD